MHSSFQESDFAHCLIVTLPSLSEAMITVSEASIPSMLTGSRNDRDGFLVSGGSLPPPSYVVIFNLRLSKQRVEAD